NIGIVRSKLLLVVFMVLEAALVSWFSADRLMTAFSLVAAIWFLADATLLWRERLYDTCQMRGFLLGWNVVALVTMPLVWWSGALTRIVR
ncbi:MAG TPA: hypothetical protein VNB29_06075, partial [Chthoniobacterales bacterium]|nr:hypothetical protein [Chthoniobacterales bacterium]